ncbi:MAG: tRNA pseudouridine(55) synthase TruB [Synergistaceae bacterium]|jgi:tRNA pseudouridine55 synthase/riboflavin kinase/FMN adenylyltransferase|nr:tRNA pseudouridine(55) synthase TruB [Synergistaceae bacterium]
MLNGLLLLDKPVGFRSAQCVAKVKCLLGGRVGHAGALDSTASGLLLALLGTTTRLSDYIMKLPKVYETLVRLGVSTDTCDASGRVIFRGDPSKINESAFDRVLCSFWGTRMQRPPEISALKVNGKPSYKTARGGEEAPPLTPRPVTVTSAERRSPLADGAVCISVTCGKGVYIRALVRDIGERLGCGAHVGELRRLSIGPFRVSDACPPDGPLKYFRSPREVGSAFHRVLLTPEAEDRLLKGLYVPLTGAGRYVPGVVALKDDLCVEGASMIGFAKLVEVEGDLVLKPKANVAVRSEVAG